MDKKDIKLLLANDHVLLRSGIRNGLLKNQNIHIIAEAGSFPELMEKLSQFQTDILMSDDIMPGGSLIELIPKIKREYPSIKIIANTMHSDMDYIAKLIQVTNGLVHFASDGENFIKAVETVYVGGIFFHIPGFNKIENK